MPKPKPANQEAKRITKPSTDMKAIAYDKMTPAIRDAEPFLRSIESESTLGTKTFVDPFGSKTLMTGKLMNGTLQGKGTWKERCSDYECTFIDDV
jgi:hypothetical protein